LEIGLGNGRTYDHLRTSLPGREIYVFERSPAAHPSCIPPQPYLIVGDVFETLPAFLSRSGPDSAALIHVDIGTGDEKLNDEIARRISPLLASLLRPEGLLLGDRALDLADCADISSETGVTPGRYFAYRRHAEMKGADA